MVAPTLQTSVFAKTTRPALGNILRREALFARLDGPPGRTVAWVAGPPGAGKSTLAASYVEARGYQSAWIEVDPDDDDAATFFHYLGHATRHFAGRAADLPPFTAAHADDLAAFARRFFRQLFATAGAPTALVLDNLHALPADSQLYTILEAGLPQVPRHCCVLVTSRADPPAALARMRAGGELVCLCGEDLRIDLEELAEIARLRGHALPPEAAGQLQERTQGWLAGVVLMLEHARLTGRIADPPGEAPPQVIFDYLAGEIFHRFEPRIQQLLLRLACLPRMTVGIAEALTGDAKSGRLLLNLAHNDYFVREVVANGERIYQLHPLLRAFLHHRAAYEAPEAVAAPALHRGAELLRAAGLSEDALPLLVECGDWQEIAELIAAQASEMLAQGRHETLAGWLELLPPQHLAAEPRLLQAYAGSRLHSTPRAARRRFEEAFAGFRQRGEAAGMLASCCGIVNAIILEFDDLTALDPWTIELATLLRRQAGAEVGSADAAALATLIRALLLRDAGHPELARWLASAGQLADTIGTRTVPPPAGRSADRLAVPDVAAAEVATELALARAVAALLAGDFATAQAIAEGLDAASATAKDTTTRIALAIATSLRCLLDGEYGKALQAARGGLATATSEGLHAHDGWLRMLLASAALGADDVSGARAELLALEAAGGDLRRGERAFIHYLRAWLASLEGDATAAEREARNALRFAVDTGVPWLEWLVRLAMAQLLAAGNDRRGADAQLRSAAVLAQRLGSPLLHVAGQLAAAATALTAGDAASAQPLLREGLALARTHRLRHIVGLRRQPVAQLCALALAADIEPECARTLVRAGQLPPPPAALRLRQWPWRFRISTLGGFVLLRENRPVEFAAKGPGRPVELLKVLLALGGQNVRADRLADALWPHVDTEYAHKSFTTTLHRLRRILDEDAALLLGDGRLSLNPALFWVDTWALDQWLGEIEGRLRDPAAVPAEAELAALSEEVLALYQGPFLPDEAEQHSYVACREQLRARLLRCLTRITRRWEEIGQAEAAVDCYLRCIDADELCEAFYRNLMLCYERHGARGEALATYERLRTVLATRQRCLPSLETQTAWTALATSPGNPAGAS